MISSIQFRDTNGLNETTWRHTKNLQWFVCRNMLPALALLLALSTSGFAQTTQLKTIGDPFAEKKSAAAEQQQNKHSPAIPQGPWEVVQAMGWNFGVPFLAASVIALWFSIERLVMLRRGRVIPRPFVERFLQHLEQGTLNANKALTLCEQNGSPVASVFGHGIRKWGKPSVEVEQAIIDGGERQVSQLRKHLRVLNGVATVTPLLGLLGTVTGMIQAFNQIAVTDAMGKSEQLAVGIALALLTTAAGLMIAIPSLILYMYLSGRVDALVMEMDALAQDVVQLISAEALSDKLIAAPQIQTRQAKPQPTAKPQGRRAV
jgi:biopolymer transport protein ExbB